MWLNIRRTFRRPKAEHTIIYGLISIDTALLMVFLLNCVIGIFSLVLNVFMIKELVAMKCYYRMFSPVAFVFQFIFVFWMFINNSSDAALLALLFEILGTLTLIVTSMTYCSFDWRYEAIFIYLPRILSIYVFMKAFLFFAELQQLMQQLVPTSPPPETAERTEETTEEESTSAVCSHGNRLP